MNKIFQIAILLTAFAIFEPNLHASHNPYHVAANAARDEKSQAEQHHFDKPTHDQDNNPYRRQINALPAPEKIRPTNKVGYQAIDGKKYEINKEDELQKLTYGAAGLASAFCFYTGRTGLGIAFASIPAIDYAMNNSK